MLAPGRRSGRPVGHFEGHFVDSEAQSRAECLVRRGRETCESRVVPRDDHETTAAVGEPVYGIRAAPGREVACAACGRRFAGSGPIGHRDGEPLCDMCLFEGDAELGMVLALVAVTRAYAAIAGKSPAEWLEPLRELGDFARVYECFAARIGPARPFDIPGFTDGTRR